MKKSFILFLMLILIGGILYVSFRFTKDDNNRSNIVDVNKDILIGDKKINVTYIGGNMIDESLNYGYTYEKEISIVNENETPITYSLELIEREISNDLVTYRAGYTYNDEEMYYELVEDRKIDGNVLLYDLTVNAKSKMNIVLSFKSNKEDISTTIKGVVTIANNLTEKEIFIENVKKAHKVLEEKIEKLNGISESGFYTIDVNTLNNYFTGTILIDALDISDLKYYYSISNGKYVINDFNYKGELLKSNIVSGIELQGKDDLCKTHTKKEVRDFSVIPYNETGGKKKFLNESKEVVNLVKSSFNKTDKKVYIYNVREDIENNTSIRGYILINNTNDAPEYYLYLTNDIFMISGYNYSKYGDYTDNTGTIRAYKESAFNLSSSDISKVCSFSGFSECFNIREEKV